MYFSVLLRDEDGKNLDPEAKAKVIGMTVDVHLVEVDAKVWCLRNCLNNYSD